MNNLETLRIDELSNILKFKGVNVDEFIKNSLIQYINHIDGQYENNKKRKQDDDNEEQCVNCIVVTWSKNPNINNHDIDDIFCIFGKLTNITMKNNRWVVHFDDARDRDDAIRAFRGSRDFDMEALN